MNNDTGQNFPTSYKVSYVPEVIPVNYGRALHHPAAAHWGDLPLGADQTYPRAKNAIGRIHVGCALWPYFGA